MNRFTKRSLMQRMKDFFPGTIVIFILTLLLFFYGISKVSSSPVMNEKQLLEDALKRDITHCYALEGAYPRDLDYIINHYGLVYDTSKYIVNYQNIGSNIFPTFSIIER